MKSNGLTYELQKARQELEEAFDRFNWATDPRLIDQAIHEIRLAQLKIDNLLYVGTERVIRRLPWQQEEVAAEDLQSEILRQNDSRSGNQNTDPDPKDFPKSLHLTELDGLYSSD